MRSKFCITVVTMMIVALVAVFGPAAPAEGAPKAASKDPIVISYICDITQETGSVPASWMKLAAEQINKAGGILGRQVKVTIHDCKGQTSLAVEAYVRALVDDKATVVAIYPRSEIALACEAKAGEMYRDYPHIFLAVNVGSNEITNRVVTDYEKWKFVFRDNCAELGRARAYLDEVKFFSSLGAKKIALLREDLLWTEKAFKGFPATALSKGMPSMKEYTKELGMEIVYETALKYKMGMYSPIFEKITAAGADCCIFVGSPGNDTDVFVKQWVNSSARNMYMSASTSCDRGLWGRTGGQALGIVYSWGLVPLLSGKQTEIPDMAEAVKKYNLSFGPSSLLSAYADMFFIKKAIEKAGGTDDINALIKAMETVEIKGPMGTLRYQTEKIPPFFHSAVWLDPKDPMKYAERGLRCDMGQFQKNGKIVLLTKPFPGVDGSPSYYKSPAELRKLK